MKKAGDEILGVGTRSPAFWGLSLLGGFVLCVIFVPRAFEHKRKSDRLESRISWFQESVGITLPLTDGDLPLSETQKATLRPLVEKRLEILCRSSDKNCEIARRAATYEGFLFQ